MDKFKAALDSLKKIASAKDEQEMFRLFSENKENFDTVQQRWFGHSRDTETVQVENKDYLQNIVRYVDIAISISAEDCSLCSSSGNRFTTYASRITS